MKQNEYTSNPIEIALALQMAPQNANGRRVPFAMRTNDVMKIMHFKWYTQAGSQNNQNQSI